MGVLPNAQQATVGALYYERARFQDEANARGQ
jgi:hypothetical protein